MKSSTIGVQLFLILAFIGTAFGILSYELSWTTTILIVLGYFFYGCLGIVVTFHRKLTHQSYTSNEYITKLFSILGCFGGTGSPLAWVAIHINHHLNSDKIGDPHSPLHKGLRIFNLSYEQEVDKNTKWRMRTLITDPFHQFLHRYYFAILILWSLFLYSVGGLYLVIFFHWAPAFITAVMSNVVNYVGHAPNWFGSYRTYNLNDQSVNNWVWSIPSWGESWHNNHHRHPKKYSCGEKWWEVDISAMVIKLIDQSKKRC